MAVAGVAGASPGIAAASAPCSASPPAGRGWAAGRTVIFLVNQDGGPYAVALDRSTGSVVWRSAPVATKPGYYTNASAVVAGGVVFEGISAPEGDSTGQGGFALLDAANGRILK